eukprot:scaffold151163_cov33-Tisochrysis_lutea.AAC.3
MASCTSPTTPRAPSWHARPSRATSMSGQNSTARTGPPLLQTSRSELAPNPVWAHRALHLQPSCTPTRTLGSFQAIVVIAASTAPFHARPLSLTHVVWACRSLRRMRSMRSVRTSLTCQLVRWRQRPRSRKSSLTS